MSYNLLQVRQNSPSFDGNDVASISDNSNEGTDIGEEYPVARVLTSATNDTHFPVKIR